jgi:hypothetical protein
MSLFKCISLIEERAFSFGQERAISLGLDRAISLGLYARLPRLEVERVDVGLALAAPGDAQKAV